MRKLKLLSIALMFFLPIAVTYAQSKIAHINTQKLISEMPEVISAQKQLKAVEKTYTEEIENIYNEYNTKLQSYSADADNQTKVTNDARQAELESMQENISKFRESAAQDLQKKQNELMRPLYDKAKLAIEKVGTNQGFDYIIDSSPGGSVIMAKGKDIYTDVRNELGF